MAGPRTCCNLLPTNENKLARNALGALTEDSSTPTPTLVASRAPTPVSVPAPTSAQASIPGLPGLYTYADLQKAIKLALELFVKNQEYGQLQASTTSCEQPFKARFPNLYYGNSHLDCYHLCQQCEDYFETARAIRLNQIFFAPLFLCRLVVQQLHQHKRCFKAKD